MPTSCHNDYELSLENFLIGFDEKGAEVEDEFVSLEPTIGVNDAKLIPGVYHNISLHRHT